MTSKICFSIDSNLSFLFTQGNVEHWLSELLRITRKSIHGIIRSAAMTIADPAFKLLEFENMFPAQVCFVMLYLP